MSAARSIKRLVIWLGLLGIVGLVWLSVVMPLLDWRSAAHTNLETSQGKAERLIASIADLENEKELLSTETDFEGVWTAASVSEATARVQAALSGIARDQGVAFRSIAPLQSPQMPLMSAVAFKLEAEVTLDRLVLLLRELEFSSPILLVERGTVRRLARGSTASTQPTVFVQLEVTAPVLLPENAL